jgi:hypothetical protein
MCQTALETIQILFICRSNTERRKRDREDSEVGLFRPVVLGIGIGNERPHHPRLDRDDAPRATSTPADVGATRPRKKVRVDGRIFRSVANSDAGGLDSETYVWFDQSTVSVRIRDAGGTVRRATASTGTGTTGPCSATHT